MPGRKRKSPVAQAAVVVSFKHLPTTAKEIRIISDAARDARAILYDLERSQQRKRLDISYLMLDAARRIREIEAKQEAERRLTAVATGTKRRARPYRGDQ